MRCDFLMACDGTCMSTCAPQHPQFNQCESGVVRVQHKYGLALERNTDGCVLLISAQEPSERLVRHVEHEQAWLCGPIAGGIAALGWDPGACEVEQFLTERSLPHQIDLERERRAVRIERGDDH